MPIDKLGANEELVPLFYDGAKKDFFNWAHSMEKTMIMLYYYNKTNANTVNNMNYTNNIEDQAFTDIPIRNTKKTTSKSKKYVEYDPDYDPNSNNYPNYIRF